MSKNTGIFGIVSALLLLFGDKATGEESLVKARQSVMSYVGANMRTLAAAARDPDSFDAQYVKTFGSALAAMSLALPVLFESGSETSPGSDASSAISTQREDFLDRIANLEASARKMAAQTDHAGFAAAFQEFAGQCRSCHSVYRN